MDDPLADFFGIVEKKLTLIDPSVNWNVCAR